VNNIVEQVRPYLVAARFRIQTLFQFPFTVAPDGVAAERDHWRFIGDARGIYWSDLDEDISVENLHAGKPSAESQASFQRWIDQRAKR
jgi:hypothetical protein